MVLAAMCGHCRLAKLYIMELPQQLMSCTNPNHAFRHQSNEVTNEVTVQDMKLASTRAVTLYKVRIHMFN